MKTFLKAAVFGAALAVAVFFLHFLIPVLLLLLFFGLIRRAFFGQRWRHAYAYSYDYEYGYCGNRTQRTPTVDGRDWQRPGNDAPKAREVHVS